MSTTLIGSSPDQVPVNALLGSMAFQDAEAINIGKDSVVDGKNIYDAVNLALGDTGLPSVRPLINLDFVNNRNLDGRITFTRASRATYHSQHKVLASHNLFNISKGFAPGSNVGLTTVVSNATDWFGTANSASTITEDTANTGHYTSNGTRVNKGKTYTFTCHLKAGTASNIQLGWSSTVFIPQTFANFELSNGTVTRSENCTARITPLLNGWYRCSITGVAVVDSNVSCLIGTTNSSTMSYFAAFAGTGRNFFLGETQMEERSTPGDVISTNGGIVMNYTRPLITANINEPRFDTDPITGERLGLLLERTQSNYLLQSEDFSDSNWSKFTSNVMTNMAVAPDATGSADYFYEDSTNSNHTISQTVTSAAFSNTRVFFSVYAKAASLNTIQLVMTDGVGAEISAIYNLLNGTTAVVSSGYTDFPLNTAVSAEDRVRIVPVGDGWYRCDMVAAKTATSPNTTVTVRMRLMKNGTTTYLGDGKSGLYIWGAMLSASSIRNYSSTYIPTTTSQSVRSMDAAEISDVSSFFTMSGTFVTKGKVHGNLTTQGQAYAELSDGTIYNYMSHQQFNSDGDASTSLNVTASSTGASLSIDSPQDTVKQMNIATAFDMNNFRSAYNGTMIGSDNSTTLVSWTKLVIGDAVAGGRPLSGWIKNILLYPEPVTDAQLLRLTEI